MTDTTGFTQDAPLQQDQEFAKMAANRAILVGLMKGLPAIVGLIAMLLLFSAFQREIGYMVMPSYEVERIIQLEETNHQQAVRIEQLNFEVERLTAELNLAMVPEKTVGEFLERRVADPVADTARSASDTVKVWWHNIISE